MKVIHKWLFAGYVIVMFLTWYPVHKESESMRYAIDKLPQKLMEWGIVPESANTVYIGTAREARNGRFVYMLGGAIPEFEIHNTNGWRRLDGANLDSAGVKNIGRRLRIDKQYVASMRVFSHEINEAIPPYIIDITLVEYNGGLYLSLVFD